jgi:hypothetical protein
LLFAASVHPYSHLYSHPRPLHSHPCTPRSRWSGSDYKQHFLHCSTRGRAERGRFQVYWGGELAIHTLLHTLIHTLDHMIMSRGKSQSRLARRKVPYRTIHIGAEERQLSPWGRSACYPPLPVFHPLSHSVVPPPWLSCHSHLMPCVHTASSSVHAAQCIPLLPLFTPFRSGEWRLTRSAPPSTEAP